MGTRTKVLGGYAQLDANPITSGIKSPAGVLDLHCTNGSNYSFNYSAQGFQSPTPSVATASFAGTTVAGTLTGPINVSGRSGFFGLTPTIMPVGEWHAIAKGPGQVIARVDFSNVPFSTPNVVSIPYSLRESVVVT